MSRAILTLANRTLVDRAINWVINAPVGTRVEFKAPQRTLDQNAKMWAMLTDIATQKKHCDRKWSTNHWKVLFLHAIGREAEFMPTLDGSGFIPYGQSSSDLSKAEMAEMIEFMTAWGAENGVVFTEPEARAA